MKRYQKIVISLISIAVIGVGVFLYFSKSRERSEEEISRMQTRVPHSMKLTSPAFEHNQSIPAKYTCDGEDINPPLHISEIPAGAKSLVLIVDDPDAPRGTWDHWIVFNIDPTTTLIAENSVPEGAVEGKNDFGGISYGGPCPPSGTHHYHFKLYALDKALELDSSVEKEDIENAMESFILDQTEFIGLYGRQ